MDGINAFSTDNRILYARKILRLLQEPELVKKFSEGVTMTFKNQHSSSAIYSKLDKVLGIIPD